jgi:hypothetical protein
MAVSVRTRFEIFKRDDFRCAYCGRQSPEVVLEVDHIVPRCEGGSDDPMNLTTSCWECNRGKSGEPLGKVMTGEDPHDAALLMLEKERQLREYNYALAEVMEREDADFHELKAYWLSHVRWTDLPPRDNGWLLSELRRTPAVLIRRAMQTAIMNNKKYDLSYAVAVLKNLKSQV